MDKKNNANDIQAENIQSICKKTSIGGQALIEGIMMRGPTDTAMAVRDPDGEIVLEKWKTNIKKTPRMWKLPLFRGLYNMGASLSIGYKCLMRSAEIAGLEDEPKEDKQEQTDDEILNKSEPVTEDNNKSKQSTLMSFIMIMSAVLGFAIAILLFFYLPSQLFVWVRKLFNINANMQGYSIVRSIFEGVVKIIIFVGYLLLVSQMKDIKRTFMYHGAEHKTIFCYERGLPLTVDNIRTQKRFHPRCGTSFMIILLLISIIIGIFINVSNPFLRTLVKFAFLPLTVGFGYEIIKFAGRHDNLLVKIISAPGMWLQRITTKEPEDDMIECAIAAMNEVIPKDNTKDTW